MSASVPLAVFDLLTHSKVGIAADAASVWRFIADTDTCGSPQALVHVDSERDLIGDRFLAVDSDAPEPPLFFVENVELIPMRLRTIRLNALDGAFVGFATWELTAKSDETVVTYDVYCRYARLSEGASEAEVLASAKRRMDEGLLRLKGVVEGAGSGGMTNAPGGHPRNLISEHPQ